MYRYTLTMILLTGNRGLLAICSKSFMQIADAIELLPKCWKLLILLIVSVQGLMHFASFPVSEEFEKISL